MTQARRVSALIKYDNKDISADLMPYVKNISYRDAMSGQADDLQLTLEDRQGLWQSAWMPELGATLDVRLLPKTGRTPVRCRRHYAWARLNLTK